MHADLLWTINDFPTYVVFSKGWSTKGYLTCPCCMNDTYCERLECSCKQVYIGHRRYLERCHHIRRDKQSFDSMVEN